MKPKLRFKQGLRVRVTEGPLKGATGTVHRVLMRDSAEAWIAMDRDIPEDMRRFPSSDPRGNHVCLFDDQCEAE